MSQTDQNLKDAFAGEAKAAMRLYGYAAKADEEGYTQVAKLFRAIAAAEKIHALKHLMIMDVIGTTEENLERSFESETTVSENVYPALIKQAEADGNDMARFSFTHARDAEAVHAGLYKKVIGHMVAEEEPTYHVCTICGYVVDGEPPDQCPVCGAMKEFFLLTE